MNIFLIRHGQTNWNKEKKIQGICDVPLNEVGIEQAKDRAEYFLKEKIIPDKIYCSNKKRAIKTASILAEKFSLQPIITDDLQEINLGTWQGKKWADIRCEYPKEFEEFEGKDGKYFCKYNGESYDDVSKRVIKKLKEICKKEEGKNNIFIVTHGAVIMTVRLSLKDKNWIKKDPNLIPRNLEFIQFNEKEILEYEF